MNANRFFRLLLLTAALLCAPAMMQAANGNGNTDTMMLARLDTRAHTIDVVSLPRDTMVNAGWEIHKLNAAYAVGALNGSGAESLCRHIAKLIGFAPGSRIMDLGKEKAHASAAATLAEVRRVIGYRN